MQKNNFYQSSIKAIMPQSLARVMHIQTPHGVFDTPAFMPVATRAYMNLMTATQLRESKCSIILGGNTYHMLLYPGTQVIKNLGGMHTMMDWQGPMLTDSGGFQIFSLSKYRSSCTVNDQGAIFKHPYSGQIMHITPEISMHMQHISGADIIMAFDECTPGHQSRDRVARGMHRTHQWLNRCIDYHTSSTTNRNFQALFGIVQGGSFEDLRLESLDYIQGAGVAGIGIGGEAVGGSNQDQTYEVIRCIAQHADQEYVRYPMGVGLDPEDILQTIFAGGDIFDCVAPTRNARHGSLYSGFFIEKNKRIVFESEFPRGRLSIKKICYASDTSPIMDECICFTCKNYTRGYLHMLYKMNSMLYINLACMHNISVMNQACRKAQEYIIASASASASASVSNANS